MNPPGSSSSITASVEHIVLTPGTCGGKPRIRDTRIKVRDIVVWHERLGRSADEIVRDYPHLQPADVYAALAYYYDHREQINAEMAADDALAGEMKAKAESKLSSERIDDVANP